jgi:hypothetical protein
LPIRCLSQSPIPSFHDRNAFYRHQ